MARRKIIWQYWKNPFGDDTNEFVEENEADVKSPWEINEEENYGDKVVKIRPVIPTPMGFMPIQPFQNFVNYFEFWMGHTNFDITEEVQEKIESTPGVEILDVITRYCFRFAVGKAFDGREVRMDIQRRLDALPPVKGEINPRNMKLDQDTKEKLDILQKMLPEKFPFWAVYVLPNGEIDVAGANTREGYDMHLDLYSQAQKMAGGIIYQYD